MSICTLLQNYFYFSSFSSKKVLDDGPSTAVIRNVALRKRKPQICDKVYLPNSIHLLIKSLTFTSRITVFVA